jgi:DNA modification methylase
LRNAAVSLSAAAAEKRDSLSARVRRCREIIEANPGRNWIIWCELEDERREIERELPGVESIWGSQDIEAREAIVERFAEGRLQLFGTKPSLSGSGSNFQEHCYSNIFLGLGYKFADFIQSIHRTQRFGQLHEVDVHLIYMESEDPIYDALMEKWRQHNELQKTMSEIIREYGLNHSKAMAEMRRSISTRRQEVKGSFFTCVNTDNVPEVSRMQDNSVDLVVTSWPFSDHYEYTEEYNDFGHNDGDEGFFAQMEFLTPEILRVLKPGRMYCLHAKDRIVYGTVSGDGMYTVNPFSDKCVDHLRRHGFRFCGRITVVTDVVRENNQTYRLGWTENSKDGTKMGVGSPEYVLLFRKLPSDRAKSYADSPVTHPKDEYSRARWQFDAHSFWRSNGDRFLSPEEIASMPMDQLREAWHRYSVSKRYDFREHVSIAEEMEKRGILPASFMALDPPNPGSPWVWDDVTRMRTLNAEQARKGWEQHVCPLQVDIVERLIERYSNKGELVLDPFGGLGTVAYCAVLMGRRGYSVELNDQYWRDSVAYCRGAEEKVSMPTLFDLVAAEDEIEAAS